MAAGMGLGGASEAKSLADVFMGSSEFKSAQESGFKNVQRIVGELEGKSIHSLTAGTYTAQSLGMVEHTGITERAMRKTRIRDLYPKSTTKAAVLHGVIETGWVNNAKQVRQRYAADGTSPATGTDTDVFGHKPKSTITLRNVMYPVATIAHTLDAHKNILDDEPRLRTFLNTRMAEGVKYAEDYDLLHSVGSSEEITGLFNVTGVQNYTGLAADKYSVQIRRAITKAQLAEYDPTGIVISPEMWENVEVEEDGYGGFRVAVNVAVGAVKQVWHLDVACTTAMSDENFLIGAFGLGAQLHDREAVNVTMSTENNDNFERNVVTFRAEERVALEVPRPESFVVGSWTTPVA
jgi:HK97 family phage major capsid protein